MSYDITIEKAAYDKVISL